MTLKDKHLDRTPFPAVANSRLNALVGNDYFASDNYIDGYMKASELMLKAMVQDDRMYEADTIIFPILYSARHAIELSMKRIIEQLARCKKTTIKTPVHGHDIAKLSLMFSGINIGDRASSELRAKLNGYVQTLAALDPDGQGFRYAQRANGNAMMEGQIIIGLPHVGVFIEELNNILHDLRRRIDRFAEEFATKTFTNELSRSDLEEISYKLPPLDTWGQIDFGELSEAICNEYGLSEAALLRGLDQIKGHREFGGHIGVEAKLLHATDETVLMVVEKHLEKNPPPSKCSEPKIISMESFSIDIRQCLDEAKAYSELIDEIVKVSSPDELADISAIYYLFKADSYVEAYEKSFEMRLRDFEANGVSKSFSHVFDKLDLVDCLAGNIRKLGRTKLADEICKLGLRRTLR